MVLNNYINKGISLRLVAMSEFIGVRGHELCPKCDHFTAIRTSSKVLLWQCLRVECGVYFDADGDIYEPAVIQEGVK